MPLAEFLRICKGKMDSTQQRTFVSTHDPSSRPETDFMELVWENGQIMMQGQSRKGPILDNFHSVAPNTRNANGLKPAKFSMVDTIPADFQMPVDLDHDVVDIVPWLNYPPIDDPLPNEYNTSDFLRELSGVTMNDLSNENHLASREKRSSFQGNGYSSANDNSARLRYGNTSKAPSSTEKHLSSLSNVTRNNNGSSSQIISRDSIHNPSSLCAFTSLRLQKLDAGQPSNTTTSSGFTNFPCISRHAALARANHVNLKGTNRSENDDQRLALSSKDMVSRNNQSVVAPMFNGNSESFPAKPDEQIVSSKDKLREDVVMNDALQNPADRATVGRPEMGGERNKEQPVVVTASSVCSGNSVERGSNEHKRNLKRKSRHTGESEDPSEEVEEESVGVRKAPRARRGLKRTRAAEVHNLSERRRRDRINEKMRALQELIPNCNKVDKASMLDEAIEYLKTLQLQVQMFSMGGGMYMPPMMLPPVQGAHMPHFSPMGVGMGLGMGMGMGMGFNMLDMNSGMKMIPFQGPHYPIPNTGPAFQGMSSSSFQAFGHQPGQGSPMPIQRPPVLPASGVPSLNIPTVLGVAGSANALALVPSIGSKDIEQTVHGNNVESSMNQASNQLPKESTGNPPASHDEAQAANANASSDAMPSWHMKHSEESENIISPVAGD